MLVCGVYVLCSLIRFLLTLMSRKLMLHSSVLKVFEEGRAGYLTLERN